jgi:hypothetical protein
LAILKGLFLLFLVVCASMVTLQALLPVVGFYPAALGAGVVFYLAVFAIDRPMSQLVGTADRSKVKSKLLYLAIAAALVVVGFSIWETGVPKPNRPALSPTARDVAQNQCAGNAFASYLKAKVALGQQQGSQPLPSVDQVIEKRRLQEQFCFQFARCTLPEGTPEARALVLETLFSDCLRDEALEEYDATPRE